MRKFFTLLSLVALFAIAAVPSFAQDSNTIADIVIASSQADEPEFATLLTAVLAADEGVVTALSDADAELTVFAPTDAAFAALAEALGEEAFGEILADTDMLTEILLYHVLGGAVMAETVVAGLEEGDFSVQTLQGQYADISANDNGPTIDGANIIMTDIEADNGVIHVIDAVIVPEFRTIAEIVVDSASADEAEFSTLLAAVGLADEAVLTALSDGEGDLTVFAPTDAAFGALVEALGEETFNGILEDQATLTDILLYHVVAGSVYSGDIVGMMEDAESLTVDTLLADMPVEVTIDMGTVYINDSAVVIADIEAYNGVIHVIDAVLVPDMGE